MEAVIVYTDEYMEPRHYYTDWNRLIAETYHPLVTACVLEVDEAGTPYTDRVLATWQGFLKKPLTDAQQKQLMSQALENYIEREPKETPAFVSEGWGNLWEDYTPYTLVTAQP